MDTLEITSLQPAADETQTSTWRDWLGIVASIGCAIHCAAMPFVFAYLPAWGLSFLADESFHKWMALACFLIAIAAFVPGLRKHGSWIPIGIGAFGLTFITFAAFGFAGDCCAACAENQETENAAVVTGDECEDCECCKEDDTNVEQGESLESDESLLAGIAPWITPFGGLCLVAAHLLNRRYGCLCGCCKPCESNEQVAEVA